MLGKEEDPVERNEQIWKKKEKGLWVQQGHRSYSLQKEKGHFLLSFCFK